MRRLSGEIGPQAARTRVLGELLPLEGWLNVELHCHLDEVGPSDRHPDLAQVLLSVPPPEETGRVDHRAEALTNYIIRTLELGADIEELERDNPAKAAEYQYLAETLVPWLVAAPRWELKGAWDRGYEAGRRRADQANVTAPPTEGCGTCHSLTEGPSKGSPSAFLRIHSHPAAGHETVEQSSCEA
ncbi:hypothetical protein [Streptomyces sp. NPDC048650]|uniref:hypothetical protein n=1 Tax=Streptomyces sp. NPDC048650 TaxID=3365583 RepID=UPI0037219F44